MRKILSILLLLLMSMMSYAQTPVGSWSDHLVYNTTDCVTVGTDEVYASTGSSIIIYNKGFAELKKMSRNNGLTETGISTISWSEENKTLVIAYTSTNVDLLKNNIIYNIPDISRKYIPGKKEINRIRTNGKYAYMACSFGIVVIDLIKKEIYDTWEPGNGSETTEVWDIAFGKSRIYAATDMGVYSADLSNQGLSYFGWAIPNISQAIVDNEDIWIADLNSGLIRGQNMSEFTALTLPGPVSNNAFNITSYNGKTVICGGATDVSWNNQGRPLQVSIYENNNWTFLPSGTIIDPMRTLIDLLISL